jgi:regulator of cell morphogenesis and NO signaling
MKNISKQEEVIMASIAAFNEATKKLFKTLKQYVPIVARVHGSNHPEFYEVRKMFDTIVEKVKEAGSNNPELNEEFSKLREITNNYKVPGDVCESYEAVYNMLAEIDKAYHA